MVGGRGVEGFGVECTSLCDTLQQGGWRRRRAVVLVAWRGVAYLEAGQLQVRVQIRTIDVLRHGARLRGVQLPAEVMALHDDIRNHNAMPPESITESPERHPTEALDLELNGWDGGSGGTLLNPRPPTSLTHLGVFEARVQALEPLGLGFVH